MSHHSEDFCSSKAVNRYLRSVGVAEGYSQPVLGLLQEYQSLRGKEDEAFQRGCAELAFENIQASSPHRAGGLSLTDFGVTFEELLEQFFNDYGVSEKEKQYATALCEVNTEFLEEWDRIRRVRGAADTALKQRIEEALRRSRSLFVVPLKVKRALEEAGYTLVNPGALSVTTPTIVREGLKLVLRKDGLDGEVVFMPDGAIFTHVNAEAGLGACRRASEGLRRQVGEVVKQVGLITGTPIRLSGRRSGFGDGSDRPAVSETPQRSTAVNAGPIVRNKLKN
ncbi:hypothetical protein HOG48_03810 [Candidatus Peregrinibacteria bacterium]|jgi:hypothetical protein|nr:hypothetical protein [Candidatus Peregrinibacteria bacterium]